MSPRIRNRPTLYRLFALFLFLAVALVAANLLYSALSARDEVLAGAAGDLLYAATFSGFADEWELYEGQQSALISDEQLELIVSAQQTATWSAARPHFADFDVSIRAVAHEGPLDNAFGLVFRVRDVEEGACVMPAVILCGIDDLLPLAGAAIRQVLDLSQSTNYFAFLISSDGYYSLWQTESGVTQILSAWIPSTAINQDLSMANNIRVTASESRYQFYVNGMQLMLCVPNDPNAVSTYAGGECIDGSLQDTYRDDSHPTGRLGLIAQSTSSGGGGVVVRFDNMIVLSPAERSDEDARL